MTAKWKVGLTTFFLIFAIGLVVRAAVLWLFGHDESHFGDMESLGMLLMIAVFAGLGKGSRP